MGVRGLLLIVILECLSVSLAMRTPSSWDNLFRSGSRSKFKTDLSLKERQVTYAKSLHPSRKYPLIVQFPEGCGSDCHEMIKSKLESSSHYSIIDHSHGLVYSQLSTVETIQSDQSDVILDVTPFLPELKIESNLNIWSVCSLSTHIAVTIVFLPLDSDDLEDMIHFLVSRNDIVYETRDFDSMTHGTQNILTLSLNCSTAEEILKQLSERSVVQWIESYYEMKPLMRWASGLTQSGFSNKVPIHRANLTGYNQVIGIADTGLDVESCFFRDDLVAAPFDKVVSNHRKLVTYRSYVDSVDLQSGHGTLVSGSAAGKCLDEKSETSQYNGLAYDAKIAFMDIGKSDGTLKLPSDHATNVYLPLYQAGARVMSMSWGDTSNSYSTSARSIDVFMWDHPDSLILVAAGNDGLNGANTVGSPATNKNGIGVGASLNDEESWNINGRVSTKDAKLKKGGLAKFSSRGPTADGRLKPEICGVGSLVSGPDALAEDNNDCKVRGDEGTSFSSPILGGASVLIRQYFMEGWLRSGKKNITAGFNPSGALIKAVLIHSGQALTHITDTVTSDKTKWGDNNQGYGRADLSQVLSFDRKSTLNGLTMYVKGAASKTSKYYVEIAKSKTHTYTFRTQTKITKPIRVTLAWTDMYGTVGSAKVLINDLDLTISNGTYTWSPVITHVTEKNKKYDVKNNLEMISLSTSQLKSNTTYTIQINARSLSTTQSYALVITGEIGAYQYHDPNQNPVASGLTSTAKALIGVACGLSFCLTATVFWIAFGNRRRREKINFVKRLYQLTIEAVLDELTPEEFQQDQHEEEKEREEKEKKRGDEEQS